MWRPFTSVATLCFVPRQTETQEGELTLCLLRHSMPDILIVVYMNLYTICVYATNAKLLQWTCILWCMFRIKQYIVSRPNMIRCVLRLHNHAYTHVHTYICIVPISPHSLYVHSCLLTATWLFLLSSAHPQQILFTLSRFCSPLPLLSTESDSHRISLSHR